MNRLQVGIFFMFIISWTTEMSFIFYCDSDLHFQEDDSGNMCIRSDKKDNVSKIKSDKNSSFVIVAGDMTHNGSDDKKFLCTIPISGRQKQLQGYIDQYANALTGIPVYECMGNHDNWSYFPYVYKAVEKYIKDKFGATLYSWKYGQVLFVCLGIYPDDEGIRYLNSVLDGETPTVLIFHYNLDGPWSDFWTTEEKDRFYNTIKGNKNILMIITGHIHASKEYLWNGFKVITCGGPGLMKCTYNHMNNKITVNKIL